MTEGNFPTPLDVGSSRSRSVAAPENRGNPSSSSKPVWRFFRSSQRGSKRALVRAFVASTLIVAAVFIIVAGNTPSTRLREQVRETPTNPNFLPKYSVELEPPRPEFTDAVQKAVDENGVVVVLSASAGYIPNVLNSMCSMKRVGVRRALMVALDREIFDWANNTGFFVPVMLPGVDPNLPAELIKYAKPGFSKIAMSKFQAVEPVLATGKQALFIDGDIFWCHKNPVPEIISALEAQPKGRDIVFQTSYEPGQDPPGDFINTGLFLVRPTVAARTFFLRIAKDAKASPTLGNQRSVNNRLCKEELGGHAVYEQRQTASGISNGQPIYCARDELQVGFLDVERFPDGPTRTAKALSRSSRRRVRESCDSGRFAMLHNNYIEGAMKELRFKAQGLWYGADDNLSCLPEPLPRPIEELKACGRSCSRWLKDKST